MIKTIEMNINALVIKFNRFSRLNLTLLLILCIVTQHSFLLKILGLAVVVLLNISSLKGFSLKKIPAFYFLIICIEVFKFICLNESYGFPHLSQFLVGISYWVASLLICYLLYDTVEKGENISRTLNVIAILNFAFSIFQLLKICMIEHVANPYNTGHMHPYGISSGDLINGLFHGVHLTNAFVSLFLIVYYTNKKKLFYVGICLISLLLTGSNYATIILLVALGVLFINNKSIHQKLIISGVVCVSVVFYWFITPLNAEYMLQKMLHISATMPNAKRDIETENSEIKNGYREVAVADTNRPYDVAATKKILVKDTAAMFDFVKQPGKMRSYYQTKAFLTSSVAHFLFGAGMGGFSSKLAFNSSGVMEGSSLNKYLPKYETPYFKANHKALYAYLKTQHVMFHSESNRPFSVYNQLAGEYGIIGLILFVGFYLWYFFKRIRKSTFALPIFVSLFFMFNIDYFIESLSILLVFELLMFMDIKEKSQANEL